ncbi:MAG: UDP-3-O-(3-hydroxymyristoyl)glucosamine N-acyltransferase [Hyphomicrobiales bacterium]|nr:UDP-3-O-(3-hydroxymyristoyl)glucosamine N-acyltransferase [Hyphomicrobiales bacterium]
MSDPVFFQPARNLTVGEIADLTGAALVRGDAAQVITNVAPLDLAGPGDLTFLENSKYAAKLPTTTAGACLCASKYADRVPADTAVLVVNQPQRANAVVLATLFPTAMRLAGAYGDSAGVAAGAHVHETAQIEDGATVEPGAVVGAGAEIGSGTVIAAGAVVGAGVRIGRDGYVGPNATVIYALIGNRVIIHPGVRIGQDGFGFSLGGDGHLKVPQVGRVIIQDDVEIGANTTIDRGATRDTVIGEGTKIDNLVQIGHNVEIGRHCVIVAMTGISGSAKLEDFVALGASVGIIGHVTIGAGAQIAATSNVKGDVPPGVIWGGSPARPIREWLRELTVLQKLTRGDAKAAPKAPAGSETEGEGGV